MVKISVIMITYNHANYIKQSIESILDQETEFEFELIISNDNSPDHTDEIVNDIILTHPKGNLIQYYNHEKNLGMMPNFMFTLQKATGKYIALCEGDDYWTDKNKLQKQVDFLEKNQDYSICFHNVNVLEDDILKENNIKTNIAETTTIEDLAKANYMHTPSVVYKNNLFENFPDYFIKAPIGDYFLHLLNAKYGKIRYFTENMAVYRLHNTSYWSSKQQLERENIWIDFIENIKINFDKNVQKILSNQIYKIRKNQLKGIKKIQFKIDSFFKRKS